MRLLLEHNLSPSLVPLLSAAGHDATHVRDVGLASAPDGDVLHRAETEDRILVSADTDFGTLLARTGRDQPSVVLLRLSLGRRSTQIAELLIANLLQIQDELEDGAVVVIRDQNLRVRRLPLPPGR